MRFISRIVIPSRCIQWRAKFWRPIRLLPWSTTFSLTESNVLCIAFTLLSQSRLRTNIGSLPFSPIIFAYLDHIFSMFFSFVLTCDFITPYPTATPPNAEKNVMMVPIQLMCSNPCPFLRGRAARNQSLARPLPLLPIPV